MKLIKNTLFTQQFIKTILSVHFKDTYQSDSDNKSFVSGSRAKNQVAEIMPTIYFFYQRNMLILCIDQKFNDERVLKNLFYMCKSNFSNNVTSFFLSIK